MHNIIEVAKFAISYCTSMGTPVNIVNICVKTN